MRNSPFGIDGITMKAAADVVAHATHGHGTQRVGRHPECGLSGVSRGITPGVFAQQQQQLGGTWKFRRVAETAVPFVEHLDVAVDRDVERLGRGQRRFAAPVAARAGHHLEALEQFRSRLLDAWPIVFPDARQLGQQIGEAGAAPP